MTTVAQFRATRDAAVATANKTLATALDNANATIATANRTQQSSVASAEAALLTGLKANADQFALDFLATSADDTTVYGCISAWRSDSARSHIAAMITLLQGFVTRAASELDQPFRYSLPALALAKVMVAGNANLRSIFGQRGFFLDDYVNQQIGFAVSALIRAKDTIVAEAALKQLELAIVQRIDRDNIVAPSADQIAIYNAHLASGREGDFVDRLKALGL